MHQDTALTFREPTFIDKLKSRALYTESYSNVRHLPKLSEEQASILDELKQTGFVILPDYVNGETLATMQQELQSALNNLKFRTPCLAQTRIDPQQHKALIDNHMLGTTQQLKEWGVTFDASEAESYEQVIRDFNPSTLTVPMLELSATYRAVWTDPFLLTVIGHYLGIIPKLVEAYVRRNFPAPYKSMNHYWHRDLNNRFHLLKMFVFLSDCTTETGPHEYIVGSHRNYNEFNDKRYFEDREVDSLYPAGSDRRVLSTVKAGTVVIEDTRGVHRANLPVTGHRDLGFAVFMPLRPFYQHQNYSFPSDAYAELSPFQKSFIPKSCLSG